MDFTLKEALEYSEKGNIGEWFRNFLIGAGNNEKLAKIIGSSGFLGGLEMMKLDEMKRVMGPEHEKDIIWKESSENWKQRVDDLVGLIESGWDCPPFLVWHRNGGYTIADGNHRYEALKKLGKTEYWVSIWHEDGQI